jgi:allantoin racemase
MSRPRILVINPNSNQFVTQGLEQALKPLGFEGGPEIVCETLTEGPYGIENQADVDGVAMPLRRLVEGDNHSAAFVHRLLQRPGPARLPRGNRSARVRHRRMRRADGARAR